MWVGRAIPKRSKCKYTAQQFGYNSVIEFVVLCFTFSGCVLHYFDGMSVWSNLRFEVINPIIS
jgi:hypothetical protein